MSKSLSESYFAELFEMSIDVIIERLKVGLDASNTSLLFQLIFSVSTERLCLRHHLQPCHFLYQVLIPPTISPYLSLQKYTYRHLDCFCDNRYLLRLGFFQ